MFAPLGVSGAVRVSGPAAAAGRAHGHHRIPKFEVQDLAVAVTVATSASLSAALVADVDWATAPTVSAPASSALATIDRARRLVGVNFMLSAFVP